MPESFGSRLASAIAENGHLCVGIDPHPGQLAAWELEDTADGLRSFSEVALAAAVGTACAIKPQVALFERHGSAGFAALEELLAAARAAGVLTIADAKRGDIGSTMAGYAQAWLGEGSPLRSDAVTVSPYLGVGALSPALDLAVETGAGVFVLGLTSNPEGQRVQHAGGADSAAGRVLADVAAFNREHGHDPLGSVGLVIGATVGNDVRELGLDLAACAPPLLTPGYGAQGATSADLHRDLADVWGQVVVPASRSLSGAGPRGMRAAALAAAEDLGA